MDDSKVVVQAEVMPQILERVDVYSFGVLMWVVLTRERPYEALVRRERLNLWKLRELIINGTRPHEGKGGDDEMGRLVMRCWHNDPQKRPESFKEMINELKRIRDGKLYGSGEWSGQEPVSSLSLELGVAVQSPMQHMENPMLQGDVSSSSKAEGAKAVL